MSSFDTGFSMGKSMYGDVLDRQERAKEMAMRQEAHKLAQERGGLEVAGLRRVNQATDDLQTGLSAGLRNKPVIQEQDAEFEAASNAALQGRAPAPFKGYKSEFTEASDADIAGLGANLAAARGDYAGLSAAKKDARGFKADAENRKFATDLMALHGAATTPNAPPGAIQAWQTAAGPYAQMVSKFSGMDMDARVNPKTGALEVIPYNGGPVQSIPFDQALPYLMAGKRLTSQYGDVDKAVEALNKMSAEERARVMGDTNFRVGLKDKEAASAQKELEQENLAAYRKGALANDAARTQMMKGHYGGLAQKSADPKLVSENNRLYEAMQNETDPSKLKGLQRSFRANQVLIANSMGKVMSPGAGPNETVLNDREKLSYAAMLKAIEGAAVPEAEMPALYMRYGLDPAKFGAVDPVAALAKAMTDKKAAAGKLGAGAPPLTPQERQPIGTLIPPRTGAQARGGPTRPAESDAEFLTRVMGGARQ